MCLALIVDTAVLRRYVSDEMGRFHEITIGDFDSEGISVALVSLIAASSLSI